MNTPRPPAHLEAYISALGAELAVRFFLAFGGAEFYVAKDPKGKALAVEVIGLEGLRALATVRDRLPARVPTAKPWIARYLFTVDGLSKADICRRLHAAEPTVSRWLGDGPKRAWIDPRQQSLL
ncbi:hypothetical protein [Cypionkella psychrotolerans]|uniref:hypothetical protein n=1 Tax=Cypionkella psychrotolerans TaxID=1678131 RepID=UPI0006B62FB4|nr:hypothetical protein [Cypionkella psychrotolerans]